MRYLKGRLREDPTVEKKVKFSDIEDDLMQRFPLTLFSAKGLIGSSSNISSGC